MSAAKKKIFQSRITAWLAVWLSAIILLFAALAAPIASASALAGITNPVGGLINLGDASYTVGQKDGAGIEEFSGLNPVVLGGVGEGLTGGVAAENAVTEEGIQQIEQHLARPELNALNAPANRVMIVRLRAGEATPEDLSFYNHELYEKGLTDQGTPAHEAHLQTLQWQGIPYEAGYEAQLYHPSAIQQFPEHFNPAAYPQR